MNGAVIDFEIYPFVFAYLDRDFDPQRLFLLRLVVFERIFYTIEFLGSGVHMMLKKII